ncbi:RING-H2 finger protein ATL52-like [Trifolium pratense]|uniref:RING-H2 finger protein ATL52-like n=1 Tax=Trifolium pratense TaxID=57577 RepID=A0A2K3N066_TRIPR|nr:RING-H2 finger protein ATL52-like [Trifolium pratense]PNX96352.1 RING-H2 finger protein ATL52-like [Trifolium pratense]PNX96438.1 RING-H2 finger protein ATL52-like [Trifolium pratense]PNY02945.1 RING-H2 finger protein ATL52-like [Trifolium pratense]
MAYSSQSKEMYVLPGIIIIGSIVIAFIIFRLTMQGWCDLIDHEPTLPTTVISYDEKFSACMSLESHSITFMYKEGDAAEQGINQTECVICLSVFQEDESVRKLHSCKHVFHTSCIDKWLGSHSGCPLCRSKIDQVTSPNESLANDHTIVAIVDSRI